MEKELQDIQKSIDNQTNLAVKIENATVALNGNEILHDINLEIKRGEKYFILGANGAGKTTLVKTMLGYVWPFYGATVEVLGQRFGVVNLNRLRKSIAWVSPFIQEYLSRQLTGLAMVLSGPDGYVGFYRQPTEEELAKARDILGRLNASHLKNKSMLEMSSGEQMKILMARALLTKPELVILDEPNVFLDIKEREFLLEAVNELAQSCPDLTMIFISQRIEDILPVFTKGMILNSGRIEVCDEREKVLTEENLTKIFGLDIKLIKSDSGRLWAITD
ncbi:MAG: ATP-binding cassette domain-containing protein [Candidatus Gastranaerophilales bacterium]|nr:ATP-binding cassette domain-containing protein [Candidatus Gastranaerophilales bacterium]